MLTRLIELSLHHRVAVLLGVVGADRRWRLRTESA